MLSSSRSENWARDVRRLTWHLRNQWLPCPLSKVMDMATKILRRQPRRKGGATGAGQNINRWLAGVLAVAAAVSTIGLAPTADAKGTVPPRASCTGAEILADNCGMPPQPVPTHMLTPHGSKGQKMAIAADRNRTISASDSSAQPDRGSSTSPHRGSLTPPHRGSSTSPHHRSSTLPHHGSATRTHHRS